MTDRSSQHYMRKEKQKMLQEYDDKARSKDEIAEEKELISKTPKVEPIKGSASVDRNGPCPCGSGKKYKKCCGAK